MKRRNLSMLALGTALALAGTTAAAAQERGERAQREVITLFGAAADRGWMGISFDLSRGGDGPVSIEGVVPESPAARAGVERGDIVVRLNDAAATVAAVRGLRPEVGDTVRLRLRRDGRERDVRVVAGPRERNVVVIRRGDRVTTIDADSVRRRMAIRLDTMSAHLDSLFTRVDSLRLGSEARRLFRAMPLRFDSLVEREVFATTIPFSIEVGGRALAGAEFTQMNEGLGRYFQTQKGLLALRVAPESPAARAGLESGDVVVRVDGREVQTLRDLRQAVVGAAETTAKLEVIRQGRRRELTLRWERGAEREVRTFTVPRQPRRPRPATQ